MVNVDVSPSVILGVGLIGAGVSLWQIRQARPWISKDYDVVISCISLLVGGILIFQGWRLDPLLLFGQLMTTGAAVSFAVEALRLRSEVYEQEEKAALQDVFKRKGPGGPAAPGGGASFQLPPPEVGQQGGWAGARGWSDGYPVEEDRSPPGFYEYGAAEQAQASGAYAAGVQQQQQYGDQLQYGQSYYDDDVPPSASVPYDEQQDGDRYDGGSRLPYVQADYYEADEGYYGESGGNVSELSFPPDDGDVAGEASAGRGFSAGELEPEDWE